MSHWFVENVKPLYLICKLLFYYQHFSQREKNKTFGMKVLNTKIVNITVVCRECSALSSAMPIIILPSMIR